MFFILGITNGGLTVLSRVVNAALGTRVGNLKGSLVNHVVGSLAAALLVLLGASTLLDTDAGRIPLGAVPAIYLTGGCAGVLVVAASNYAAAQIGVTLLSMLLLAFQVLSSAAIDHYGWLGTAPRPMTLRRGIGLFLLMTGALVVLLDAGPPADADPPPAPPE